MGGREEGERVAEGPGGVRGAGRGGEGRAGKEQEDGRVTKWER